jgi:signal transduction histidine kinase
MRMVDGRPRTLEITTSCGASGDSGDVVLSVRDRGVGFSDEDRERLFDPFYTTKSEGMGIGLSISRSIIESHHGRLWATSNDDGSGATFLFAIPRDAQEGPPESSSERRATASMPAPDPALRMFDEDA